MAVIGQQRVPRLRMGISSAAVVYTIVLILVVTMVLAPVFFLVVNSFQTARPGEAPAWSIANWTTSLNDMRLWSAAWNSIRLYLATSLVSWPTAILIAWIVGRTDMPAKNWVEFLFWLSFFLPSLSVVLGWIVLIDPSFGLLNQFLQRLPFIDGPGPLNIYTFWGLVWVHLGQNAIALKVILLAPAFRNMDASLEEAARVSGASPLGLLRKIIIPVMAPTIAIVFVLGFVRLWQSFETERVLGVPQGFYVYGTRVYDLINREIPEYGAATVLATAILIAMMPLLIFQRRITLGKNYETLTGRYKPQAMALGRGRWPAFAFVMGIAVFVSLLPIFAVFVGTFMKLFGYLSIAEPWTLSHWQRILGDPIFLRGLRNTLLVAGGAAFLSMALLSMIAYMLVRTQFRGRAALDIISWFPQALPGILLGLGMLWLVLTPVFRPFYGSIGLLIVATVIGSMTVGVQILKGNIVQIGRELEEAGRISGGSWLYTMRRIILPLLAPTIALVGTLNFVSASRDVSNIILLASGNTQTLALLQLDYMVAPYWESASVVSVILILISTGVALTARYFGLRLRLR